MRPRRLCRSVVGKRSASRTARTRGIVSETSSVEVCCILITGDEALRKIVMCSVVKI